MQVTVGIALAPPYLAGASCQRFVNGGAELGRVVSIEDRKVTALAGRLVPVLQERGAVIVEAVDVESVDQWRKAARLAGRRLGWRMRTGVAKDGSRVWAASDDFEVSEAEDRLAGLRLDALIAPRRPPRH